MAIESMIKRKPVPRKNIQRRYFFSPSQSIKLEDFINSLAVDFTELYDTTITTSWDNPNELVVSGWREETDEDRRASSWASKMDIINQVVDLQKSNPIAFQAALDEIQDNRWK